MVILVRRFAIFTAAAAFSLIVAERLILSLGAGAATTVSVMAIVLAFGARITDSRKLVHALGWAGFAIAIAQLIFTVLGRSPDLSLFHACLRQILFAVLSCLAVLLCTTDRPALAHPETKKVRRLASLTMGFILLQLILGEAMRHGSPVIHGHLLGATLVAIHVFLLAKRTRHLSVMAIRIPCVILIGVVGFQLGLGLMAWQVPALIVFAAHAGLAALLLASAVLATLQSYRQLQPPEAISIPVSENVAQPITNDAAIYPVSAFAAGAWPLYWELTKPRVTSMVMVTTWLGFALAPGHVIRSWAFVNAMIGSWLAACGASVLNQYIERDLDKQMRRTQTRPLPMGKLRPEHALCFGAVISCIGLLQVAWGANLLAAALTALTLATYVFVYTPLKTRTAFCTLIGAVPGALPPMIGWAAARNTLDWQAWVLFGILFLWQLPHFLAIAWMYREDYARAGFPMLPVIDPEGGMTARMIILYSAILIPVTLLPARAGVSGRPYLLGALALGVGFLICGASAAHYRTPRYAKRLLLASVIYLPALLTWMVFHHA